MGRKLGDWCRAINEFLPDADLLVPQYAAHVFSNVNPRRVADQLAQYIQEANLNRANRGDGGAYKNIILIGYSSGGLIMTMCCLLCTALEITAVGRLR